MPDKHKRFSRTDAGIQFTDDTRSGIEFHNDGTFSIVQNGVYKELDEVAVRSNTPLPPEPKPITLRTVGELRAYLAGIDGDMLLELIPSHADMRVDDSLTVGDDIGVEDGKLGICI